MITAYLLTGSNLGDRNEFLDKALEKIKAKAGQVLAVSSIFESAPWGKTDQPSFLNQAIKLSTALSPIDLLKVLLNIETELGRIRAEKYGPRLIDIDILLYGDLCLQEDQLQLPHPQLPNRRFALLPLLELSPELVHPESGIPFKVLLNNCPDAGSVQQLN